MLVLPPRLAPPSQRGCSPARPGLPAQPAAGGRISRWSQPGPSSAVWKETSGDRLTLPRQFISSFPLNSVSDLGSHRCLGMGLPAKGRGQGVRSPGLSRLPTPLSLSVLIREMGSPNLEVKDEHSVRSGMPGWAEQVILPLHEARTACRKLAPQSR